MIQLPFNIYNIMYLRHRSNSIHDTYSLVYLQMLSNEKVCSIFSHMKFIDKVLKIQGVPRNMTVMVNKIF